MAEQDYVVQITVKGMDDQEREVMWNVRGRTVEEFEDNLARYAERINKLNGYHFRSNGKEQKPTQATSPTSAMDTETTCPKCGSEVYDNRSDPNRSPRGPLMKCKNQDCDWRMWPKKGAKK